MRGTRRHSRRAEQSREEERWVGIEIQRRSKKQSRQGERDKHTHRERGKTNIDRQTDKEIDRV